MRAAKKKTLKTIKKVNLRDEIKSEDMREVLKNQDLVPFTGSRRLYWKEHIDRIMIDWWTK